MEQSSSKSSLASSIDRYKSRVRSVINGDGPPDGFSPVQKRATWWLMAMSFFMGDVQQGLGPFLGVFLQEQGWRPGLRGTVTTVGGVVALAAYAPLGAFIDHSRHKRWIVMASFLVIALATLVILLRPIVWVVFLCQIATAVAGIVPLPVMTALTLGVARQPSFDKWNGINQAFNHAGMMAGAGVAALVGSRYGLSAVFWWTIALAGASILTAFFIPEAAIDHQAARGLAVGASINDEQQKQQQQQQQGQGHPRSEVEGSHRQGQEQKTTSDASDEAKPRYETQDIAIQQVESRSDEEHARGEGKRARAQGMKLLLKCKPLLILATCLMAFHLGNAAVLPFYGQAVVAAGKGNPAAITGLTIVVAQGTMIITSLLAAYAGRSSGWRGYWLVNLVSFVSLPIRCAIAGSLIESWAVWPVQVIDGIGAGLQSVSTPAIVARILGETGRVNIGLGAVMTLQNAGAALSNVFAGWVAEAQGYNVALYVLGVFPVVSVALWIGFFPVLAKSGIFRS